VQKDPQVLGAYRRKAGTRLLALGMLHIVAFFVLYWLFDLGATNKIWDYKIICTFITLGALAVGMGLVGGALAIASYQQIGRLLRAPWVAFFLFCGGVVAVCLVVWLHSVAFEVARDMTSSAKGMNDEKTTLGFTTAELTSLEIYTLFGQISTKLMIPMLAYVFWPLQFSIVRDLIAVGASIGSINIVPVFGIWW
jgi:hypothetical protein